MPEDMRPHIELRSCNRRKDWNFPRGLGLNQLKLQPIDIPKMGSEKAYSCNILFEARNDCIGSTGARDRPCCQAVVQN